MMHSLAADLPIHFYDATGTLYHHMTTVDNKKMKKIKKAKRLFVNETARNIFSMYAMLFFLSVY
jgi:hypothetical protein